MKKVLITSHWKNVEFLTCAKLFFEAGGAGIVAESPFGSSFQEEADRVLRAMPPARSAAAGAKLARF